MNNFKEQLLLGNVDCNSDEFMLALYEVALASPDGAAIAYSVTNEIDAANYVAGGSSVGTCVVTQDDANNWAKWDDDGTDVTWSALGSHTIVEARLYDNTLDPKCVAILWEIATNSNGGDYTLSFHTNGMMTLA
jgi:hypothetical protein